MRNLPKRSLLLLPLLAALTLASSACSNSSDSSLTLPSTTSTGTSSTETFSGSITQNGTAIHSFTVKTGGYTLMAGYTSIEPASIAALGLGVGAWDASTSACGLNLSQNDTGRSGSTAVSGTAGAGNYCIRVYDGGNVGAGVTATYTLQVQHY
jgi:alanine dehydrogenase